MADICTLIMAGGQGRRIGGNKADIQFRGERLIDHVLTRAQYWDIPIWVQMRHAHQINLSDDKYILDDPDIEGPLSGLIAGLSYTETKGFSSILTVACDMPFLPENFLDRLRSPSLDNNKIIIPASKGRLHPICGIWPVTCLNSLKLSARSNNLSLKNASEKFGRIILSWPHDPYDPFFNINTLDDLEHANQIYDSYLG